MRNCDCGPSKFDFCNSATLHSLLTILLFSSPFSSAQDGFKKQPKIFLELSVSGNQKLTLKGPLNKIFYLRFFFMNQPDFMAKNMKKIAEVKFSSCGLEVADFRKQLRLRNCRVAVAKQHFCKKLQNCDCRSSFFKLQNHHCGLKKKLCMPTSDCYDGAFQ